MKDILEKIRKIGVCIKIPLTIKDQREVLR